MWLIDRMFKRDAPHPALISPVFQTQQRPSLASPGEVFTPTQPKTGRRRLVGREVELQRILELLQQDRAHVVLYSERGRGKTSLANLAVEALRRDGVIVARHICEAGSTFDSIMRGLMRDLPSALLAATADPSQAGWGDGCEAALPTGTLQPRDIVNIPQRLACRSLVCVVDEFDRVLDAGTRTRLADSIKQLSDRDAPLLFLIVGVSDDLERIMGQHPSIARSVGGVHLPLFTDREIAQIIAKGGQETGFTFPPAAVARITVLSRGMPYMAQLLGLRLTQAAVARDETAVSEEDFEAAVTRMAHDAPLRVQALHGTLTDFGRDSEMVLALRRVATAPQDPWGRLAVQPSGDGMLVGGRAVSARCWASLIGADVLAAGPPGSGQYSFAERSLLHHVLLLAAREAVVSDQNAVDPALDPHEHPVRADADRRGLHPVFSRG